MNSSLISKIEKAKRYAEEPNRVQFQALEATFRGDNGTHTIRLSGDEWICECDHFQVHGLCSHVMTLQRLYAANLSDAARFTQATCPVSGSPLCLPLASSQTRAVLSEDAVTMRWPSGLNTALVT